MDLISKLAEVPAQFPIGTTNVLLVFHRSIGESQLYLQQALLSLPTGLYAKEDWTEVAGCGLVRVEEAGVLKCREFWANPRAKQPLLECVVDALKDGLS
jgi:hypothetical protein